MKHTMKVWIEFHNDAGDGEVMHKTEPEEVELFAKDAASTASTALYARLSLIHADGEDSLNEKFADTMYADGEDEV